jgi:IS605 OrfB family transposase
VCTRGWLMPGVTFITSCPTALIRDNQAVAVEDLAVKGLARTRLAKSVHDGRWSAFVAMLEYKARLYGREFHRIGRFTPPRRSAVCVG